MQRITQSATPVTSPETLPIIDDILVAADGYLWVLRSEHPSPVHRAVAHTFGYSRTRWFDVWLAPTIFDRFTPDGEYRGTVELPGDFVPLAVTRDRVYGVATDDIDVQYVVAHEIQAGRD